MAIFGVTYDDLRQLNAGLQLSASSTPTLTYVTDTLIPRVGHRVSASLRARGVDPDTLAADTEGYAIAQHAVITGCLAIVVRSTGAADDADSYQSMHRDAMRLIEETVFLLGESAPNQDALDIPMIQTVTDSSPFSGSL